MPARVLAGIEVPVTVGQPPWELSGLLTLPNGVEPFTAVVLVHGSGPNDMDSTVGPNKIFQDMAWSLAERGIASVRYTKRTKQYGLLMMRSGKNHITLEEETIDDAVLAAKLLMQDKRIDPKRVFIMGHSQGATLAPRITAQLPGIAGAVMLAAVTGPLDALVRDQIVHLSKQRGFSPEREQREIEFANASYERTRKAIRGEAVDGPLLMRAPAAFWKEWAAQDVVGEVRRSQVPLLAIFGGRDYQVPANQAAPLRALQPNKPNLTVRVYPKMNHLLFDGTGEPNSQE